MGSQKAERVRKTGTKRALDQQKLALRPTPEFLEDMAFLRKNHPLLLPRLLALIHDSVVTPESGRGRPVCLSQLTGDVWSRALTMEHRLVYRVSPEGVYLLQARYHY